MDVLREISEQGISVMVNLHSVELVRAYCTRVIGVASGQLILTITLPADAGCAAAAVRR